MNTAPAIVAISARGEALAAQLQHALPGSSLHGLEARTGYAHVRFSSVADHLQHLFASGTPIVGLCAAGVLIRVLGPVLQDKRREPPVVAVAEDGSAVVPLLGGHRGANRLAGEIAAALGCSAAITTAGDLHFNVALDDPPAGYALSANASVKPFMAALLGGARVRLDGHAPWLAHSDLPLSQSGSLSIRITEQITEPGDGELVYYPQTLVVGVGCERGCEAAELLTLVEQTLGEHHLATESVAMISTIDLKADELAVQQLAHGLARPLCYYNASALEAQTPRLAHPSDVVYEAVGCHGVSEAAALAAAGPESELLVSKRKSRRATCAVARASGPLVDGRATAPQGGRLAIIGIGSGDPKWRTPEATMLLAAATDLVGYSAYLELLGPLTRHKTCHGYGLGEEQARVRAALELAASGRSVGLVSSGDAGIYAMASLVFELLEQEADPSWQRVEITVAPGLSALQMAAARAGAPLGHDFCAISLSDLLTPWSQIERRVQAAAEGDFVIAFYNPASQRRQKQLLRARDVLLEHRSAETPVVLAHRLGRTGERVDVIDLQHLTPERVDMLTLVLVGSSQTRRVSRPEARCWVYTPRGYTPCVERRSRAAPQPCND